MIMSYKLEYKTISFGLDPTTRQPTQGIAGNFYIPSYQRGYRWTKDEVTKLLDDIWESGGEPYSLQPIVVKGLGSGSWELIDGQQRLTTLWILLRFMQKGTIPYSLEYETRPESLTYLQNIDAGRSTDNIDFFHIYQAYATIAAWFVNKMGAPYQQFLIDEMFRFLSTSVRIIWYEVPEAEKPIPLFTRLNQGRIPLTDSELIKAVLLANIEKVKSGRETEVAAQWDGIERDLQRDDIWAFVASRNYHDHTRGTRIDLLLDTLAKTTRPVLVVTTPLMLCKTRPRQAALSSGRRSLLCTRKLWVGLRSPAGTTRLAFWWLAGRALVTSCSCPKGKANKLSKKPLWYASTKH